MLLRAHLPAPDAHRQAFAREGARIGLIARGRAGIEWSPQGRRKTGGGACSASTLRCPRKSKKRRRKSRKNSGPIDVWVNTDGIGLFSDKGNDGG